MPRMCCVPGCTANYRKSDSYTTVFGFPKDEKQKEKWIKAINREDFTPSKSSVVCIQHFAEDFIVRDSRGTLEDGRELIVARKKLTLTKDAYPSIFPVSLSTSETNCNRKRMSRGKIK